MMLRYQSRRHKTLMDESEQGLRMAAEKTGADARIAQQVLGDASSLRLWEARHAELMLPIAEQNTRVPQVIAMRELEVRLVHRRALIDHIRERQLRGRERERLFRVFYGPREFRDSVLAEHRQYMLAVSSRVSADHLIDVMQDPVSTKLVKQYEKLYAQYFELYCYMAATEDRDYAGAVSQMLASARQGAERARQRLGSVRPDNRAADFERQAALARSGRHPVLNYLAG
jgi:hypothetical protein